MSDHSSVWNSTTIDDQIHTKMHILWTTNLDKPPTAVSCENNDCVCTSDVTVVGAKLSEVSANVSRPVFIVCDSCMETFELALF